MTTRTLLRRWGLVLGLGIVMPGVWIAGCGRGLLGISSTRDNDAAAMVIDDPSMPPAGASVCFSDHPAACDDTCRAATRILWTNCASCHDQGPASLGVPRFDFLLDPQRLTSEVMWHEGQYSRFVVPGAPDESLIYHRAVVKRDMPPLYHNIAMEDPPRVSSSDGQILNYWISQCLGEDHGLGGAGGGVGGTSGGGGAGGPGGHGGTSGIVAPCPSSPPSGACAIEQQTCAYGTVTCACGNRTWGCVTCPPAPPTAGENCDVGRPRLPDGRRAPLNCLYANVRCACEGQSASDVWGCGVCPAGKPAEGSACGNSSFRCSYGDDSCACSGNGWTCHTPVCLEPGFFGDPPCPGGAACLYSALNQSCACNGNIWTCACPPSVPFEGDACLRQPAPCSYGDRSCTCDGAWRCLDTCPTTHPTDGAPCHSSLSCTYGAGLCYCAGDLWHCS